MVAAVGWVRWQRRRSRLAAEKAFGKHLPDNGPGCSWGDGAEAEGTPQLRTQAEGRADSLSDLLASLHPQGRGHGEGGWWRSRAPREALSLLAALSPVSLDLMIPHPSLPFQ